MPDPQNHERNKWLFQATKFWGSLLHTIFPVAKPKVGLDFSLSNSHPSCMQILLDLSSECSQNLTTVHYCHCHHSSPSYTYTYTRGGGGTVTGTWKESPVERQRDRAIPRLWSRGGGTGELAPRLTVSCPRTSCQGLSLAETNQTPEDKWVTDVAHGWCPRC